MHDTLPTVASSSTAPEPPEGDAPRPSAEPRRTRSVSSWDTEIPPVIACARCGRPECDGCALRTTATEGSKAAPAGSALAWEDTAQPLWGRFVATARHSAQRQGEVFGHLERGSIGRALAFSLLCEVVAILGFSAVWAGAFLVLFPRFTLGVLSSLVLMGFAALVLVLLVLFVVFLHALAGAALEWCIGRTGQAPDYNRGIRMGLYSCGWDLLTSPVGVLLALTSSPPLPPFALVLAGARVPRAATSAYLTQCRGLPDAVQRAAVRTAIWSMVLPVLLFALVVFFALLWWFLFP